jgi:hypothetical protein
MRQPPTAPHIHTIVKNQRLDLTGKTHTPHTPQHHRLQDASHVHLSFGRASSLSVRRWRCVRADLGRLALSLKDPVALRRATYAHADRARAHGAGTAPFAAQFVVLGFGQPMPRQKLLQGVAGRLAFAGRVDEERKHLADATQLIAQVGDVGDGDVLLDAPHGLTGLPRRPVQVWLMLAPLWLMLALSQLGPMPRFLVR